MPIKKKSRGLIRDRVIRPIVEFTQIEAASGIFLLLCAIVAIVWANSPWADSYFHLWETPLTLSLGDISMSHSLHHWINDALMAMFFFLVGLEIKREILVGELADPRKAALPIAAAIGGMVVPALIYVGLNAGTEGAKGWGVPMATDIAFALGVLALVGAGVPLALKLFLTALAIVDDIGAVLVIAVFYTSDLNLQALGYGAVVMLVLAGFNRFGVRAPFAYFIVGAILWYCFYLSGIHATIAGVLAAAAIPTRVRMNATEFVSQTREVLDRVDEDAADEITVLSEEQQSAVHTLERACEDVQMPLERIENQLQPWVAFGIMPLFALANAGVALGGLSLADFGSPIPLGILLALVIGKPVGIFFFSYLACKLNLANLPHGVGMRQIAGVGVLGGIGFTMSLFIAELAFAQPEVLDQAKLGILSASLIAGVAGYLLIKSSPRAKRGDAPVPISRPR